MNHQQAHNNPDLDIRAADVAEYILAHWGPMDAWKLQKLTYYTQAWSLAWGRGAMFPEDFQAWQNGPVVRSLFARHRGQYTVSTVDGDPAAVDRDLVRRATIIDVCNFYGKRTGQELSEFAHAEMPWRKTREDAGVRDGEPCDCVIPQSLIESYYRGLISNRQPAAV